MMVEAGGTELVDKSSFVLEVVGADAVVAVSFSIVLVALGAIPRWLLNNQSGSTSALSEVVLMEIPNEEVLTSLSTKIGSGTSI